MMIQGPGSPLFPSLATLLASIMCPTIYGSREYGAKISSIRSCKSVIITSYIRHVCTVHTST